MKTQLEAMGVSLILLAGLTLSDPATAEEGPTCGSALPAIVETAIAHLAPHPDPPPGAVATPEPKFDRKLARLAGALAEDASYRLSSSFGAGVESPQPGTSAVVDGDWTVVTNTKLIPYRAVCYLEITWPATDEFGEPIETIGTGAFVSPRVILTSARNVHLDELGGFADSIHVYPARSGSKKPYGSAVYQTAVVSGDWLNDETLDNEVGFVILPDATLFNRVGYVMEYRTATDEQLTKWNLNSLGYPTPLVSGIKMRLDFETTNQVVSSESFRYFHDAKPGCEGGPIFFVRPSDGARQIVGFYSRPASGGAKANIASRLSDDKAFLVDFAIDLYP